MNKNMILSAKLKRPFPRKNYVVREKLFLKLDMLKDYPFVVIEGGAGVGKTTLMSSYIDERKLESVKWLTLDQSLNDPFMFFQYFTEMFHDDIQQEKYNDLFQDSLMKESLYQVVSMLCEDFQELNQQYIVLDNIHHMRDEFLCELFNHLLECLPSTFHVIMLTRSFPKIPMGRIYANHQVLTISPSELVMSDEEAKQFLTQTMQIPFQEQIVHYAHGWVAALQLLSSFSTSLHDEVMQMDILEDYIEREYLKDWDEQVLLFIRLTAILDYFDEDLCHSICPQIPFCQTIQLLMHEHILFIQLDDHTYTYHDLIKDYYTQKFELYDKEYRTQYLNTLTHYYESKHEYEQCLKYLLWNQDYERMMDLIVKIPQNGKTLAYLPKVPLYEISKNVDFAIQYFFYFYVNSDEEMCEKIYQLMHSAFVTFENMLLFIDDHMKKRMNSMITLDEIIGLNLNEVTLSIVLLKDIFLLYLRDDIDEAILYLEKAYELIQKHPYDYLLYYYFITSAQFYEYLGEYEKSILYFERARPYLDYSDSLEIGYYIGLAGVYIKQYNIVETQKCFELLDQKKAYESNRMRVAYQQTLIQLLYLQDKIKEANQLWLDFFELCDPREIIYLGHILQMRYSFQYDDVFNLFEKEYALANMDELDSDAHILHALIIYHNHHIEESRLLLEKTLAYCRKKRLQFNITEINLYLIVYFHQYYLENQIIDLWKEAIHYILENHIYLSFWFIRKDIQILMEVCHKYQLLQYLNSKEKLIVQSFMPQQPLLTTREQEVMKLLQKGYTNKQMAETLCVSLATIKTHLVNIFSKMHVNNRIEAITKYQEMYE